MGAGGVDAIQLPILVRFGGPNPLSGEGCEVRDLYITIERIFMCICLHLFVVLGHYSRSLFIGTVHRRVARRVLDGVCVEPRLVHDLIVCICVLLYICI